MSATTETRLTEFAGVVPARGTYKIAANVRILKGSLVGIDSAGRAVPGTTIAGGCLSALGKASAEYDNRTGSSYYSGLADACDVEVEYGVFEWENSGGGDAIAADDVGKVCYVVDNQTVALTSNTDTRGICGFISEFRNSVPYVWMGPHVVGMIVIAAAEASQLDTAQTDIDALEADVLALQSTGYVPIPITAALDAATGALLAVFADGASTTPGTQLVNSESACVRWNNDAAPGAIAVNVAIPPDLDPGVDVTFHALVSKTGATVGDATKLTVGAFEHSVAALHDADADFGGDTTAVVGNATAKTVTEVTLTLAHANIGAPPTSFALTIKPKAGTLGTDDFLLHSAWLEYTRAGG